MSKTFDVITVGGAVRDITLYTGQGRIIKTPDNPVEQAMLAFELGAKILVNEGHCTLGGGASNTANIFSKLNLRTAILARVGNDQDGHHMSNELRKVNINIDFLQKDKIRNTGLSVIVCTNKKDREHVAFTFRGANDYLDVSVKMLKNIRAAWCYVTSLSGPSWLENLRHIFDRAKETSMRIVWNPGSQQLQAGKKILEGFLASVNVLILNKDEAIELVLSGIKIGKRNPSFLNNTLYLLNILNEWGPKIVVITEGAKGASALHEGKLHTVKPVRKKVVDTTGVGDAFGATFIACLHERGNDIDLALKWAATNSACVLTQVGAHYGALTKAELMKPRR